jgi:probable rRNA maturation factor
LLVDVVIDLLKIFNEEEEIPAIFAEMPASISFFNADVSYVLRSKIGIRLWLSDVIKKEGFQLGELSIILCSDEYLFKMNVQYLKHITYTDIITFDQSESKSEVSGELYLSIDRIKDNAKALNINLINELHRVIVHGTLHLCGYGDKDPKSKSKMTSKENFYLQKRVFL